MIKLGCLFRNSQIESDLRDLTEYLGYALIADDKAPTVGAIFNKIRDAGIEVDIETVGFIYSQVFPRDDGQFMSDDQINEFVLHNYNISIRRAAKLNNKTINRKLGRDKAERWTLMGILNMFTEAHTTTTETKSVQVELQNALWKGLQRRLNLPDKNRPKAPTDWLPLLEQALGFEKIGIADLNGKLNSISDLYDALQEHLIKATGDIAAAKASPATIAMWEKAVRDLKAMSYSLMFSEGEARNVLIGIMKDAGFTKTLKSGKEVLDYTKLAGEIGSVNDIRNNVGRVMTAAGYDQRVVDSLKDSLVQEFADLRADIVDRQINKTQAVAREAKKIIADESGLTKALGGKTPAEWVKDQGIATLEDLEMKAALVLNAKQYEPAVRAELIKQLKEFWDKNYVRATTLEARAAIDVILQGVTPLNWIKANGLRNQQELYDMLYPQLEVQNISDKAIAELIKEFNRLLDLDNRAARNLNSREKAIGRSTQTKSDIRRLAELHNLGLFDNNNHDAVLNQILGISDVQAQDIKDLEALAKAASDLFREVDAKYGAEIFASRKFQELQRHIDKIIARNINNKTKLLQILAVIRNFFDVFLTGLLAGPFTLFENVYSGFKEGVSTFVGGGKASKEDFQIYMAMLNDVTLAGQAYGEEVGSFAPRELYSNMLQWKWKGGTAKERADSLLYAIMSPARLGLLAFDSANKVYITNKTFKNIVYQALVQNGMSDQTAERFMNEALNGQAFEDAKKDAESILNRINMSLPAKFHQRVDDASITTLANDIVKANLSIDNVVTPEFVTAALKSAYHIAGYGLGHEANNFISKQVELYRKEGKMLEAQLIKEKKWDELAGLRLQHLIINSMIFRFIGGATNWIYLRFQGAGLGAVLGGVPKIMTKVGTGKWGADIDFKDRKSIEDSIKKIHGDRNKIGRAAVGMSVATIVYTLGYMLTKGNDGDEEEAKKKADELKARIKALKAAKGQNLETLLSDAGIEDITPENIAELKLEYEAKLNDELTEIENNASFFQKIKSDWMKSRFFKKAAPDALLLHYYMETEDNEFSGMMKYIQQTTGVANQFSTDAKFSTAMRLAKQGDFGGATGALASVIGDKAGVPLWRAGKDWYKLAKWTLGGDVGPDFVEPTSMWDGILGNGAFQDWGIYKPSTHLTILPGVGFAKYERFKAHGLKTIDDLKKTPNWWELKYTDDAGNEKFILTPREQRDARKEVEEKYGDD